MSIVPPDRIHATLYDKDGRTYIGWLGYVRNVTWQEQLSAPGSASFETPLTHPLSVHITDRRIVRLTWMHRGYPLRTFSVRIQGEAIQLAVDGRRWLRFENQPGLLSMLGDAVVYPEYALSRYSSTTRLFGFMSADGDWRIDGNWVTAQGYPMSDETGHRKGSPFGLKRYDPDWIAAIWPATHVPAGTVNFYRTSLTLTAGTYVRLVVAADNFVRAYLDGEQIIAPDYSNPLGWRQAQGFDMHLAAGDRLFAFEVQNAALANGGGGNPMGLIVLVLELDEHGSVVDTLLSSSTHSKWRVHDSTPEPGWHRAQVLRQLVLEAKARGVDSVQHIDLGFTNFHDSRGDVWPATERGQYGVDVGTPCDEVASNLSESAFDVYVDPVTLTLKAWWRQGIDRSATVELLTGVDGGNLKSFEATTVPSRFTTLLTQVGDSSWEETTDGSAAAEYGRIEAALSVGSAKSRTAATRVSDAQLAQHSRPRTFVSSEPSTLESPLAYEDYNVGDTITVPNHRATGTMKARVLAITLDASGDTFRAWPEYVQDTS